MITVRKKFVQIDGLNSTLIVTTDRQPELAYLGKKLCQIPALFPLQTDEGEGHGSNDDTTFYNALYSFNGDGNNRESGLLVRSKRGELCHRFAFKEAFLSKIEKDKRYPQAREKEQTVCFVYECLNAPLLFRQYISTCKNADAFVFWTEIENKGKEGIYLQRMMSVQLDLFSANEKAYTFDGAWTRERHKHEHILGSGVFYVDSKMGASSNFHNPYTLFHSERYGYIALNLIHSGNHKTLFERNEMGKTRILSGFNDYAFDYLLESGKSFHSPEAVVVLGKDTDEVTEKMHEFVLNQIVPPQFKGVERPILLNNWEATYFDFTQEKLLAIADRAKDLGVEMFVLDDGWFGKRTDDTRGLGDWYDNVEKTGGLKSLKEQINARGMKFGLWIEPEMIQSDSDLYRRHPEYAVQMPNVKPIEKRTQLMLDMANDNAVEEVLQMLYKVIDEVQPDYIKWDYNRGVTDIYSSALEYQGDFFYRYTQGVYKMFSMLTERYPHILFEGCSSGGNRFDLGMLYFTPQIWCSDDTDARERMYIQEGTLYAYPQSCMGAHVSFSPNHGTHNCTSASDRFNIACIGAFGYELDLCKISAHELNLFKEQIAYYKKHRKLLQFGKYYRLNDIFNHADGGWIVVSEDKKEALAMVVEKKRFANLVGGRYAFKGLDPTKKYLVTMREQDRDEVVLPFEAYGDLLMQGQVYLGRITEEADRPINSNSISSRLIFFQER